MDLLHARGLLTRAAVAPSGRDETFLPWRASRDIALVVAAIVVVSVARSGFTLGSPRGAAAWLAALAFAAAFPASTLRPRPISIALCGLSAIVMQYDAQIGIGVMMIIITLIQASKIEGPIGTALALASGLGYEAATVLTTRSPDLGNLLASASGLVFAYLAAAGFRRLRAEKRKTEALLSEVLAGRDAQVHAATLDERARIAREIHDILAHTLSALAVQLEGTRLLAEQRPGDPAVPAALERASGLAREGLEETKRAVGALRGDELPGPAALPRLAADFERDTGIPCRFEVEGAPVTLTPEARLALYRSAQEALTNVRKHAAASAATMLLRYGAHEAVLTVENVGRSRATPLAGGGHGLNGMRERAELAHGRLEAGPTSSGFMVQLWLPI